MRFKSICSGFESCPYGSKGVVEVTTDGPKLNKSGPCKEGCLEDRHEAIIQSDLADQARAKCTARDPFGYEAPAGRRYGTYHFSRGHDRDK